MILDELSNAERYETLAAAFGAAFTFLRRPDLDALASGRHEIDGDRVFALVGRDEGRGRERSPLEAHRKRVDIQYVVSGQEEIGWRPLASCRNVTRPYDGEKDIGFFGDEPESWLRVPPGSFAIFFPGDAHAPLAGTGAVHKVVVKVAVDG